jgi:hypothetical protein
MIIGQFRLSAVVIQYRILTVTSRKIWGSEHHRQWGFESNKPTHIGSVSGTFTLG